MSDPLFDLEGRVAVVTGGMGQLGQVYLAGLAERGMRVASFDVEDGSVPDGARAFRVDVTDRASIQVDARPFLSKAHLIEPSESSAGRLPARPFAASGRL